MAGDHAAGCDGSSLHNAENPDRYHTNFPDDIQEKGCAGDVPWLNAPRGHAYVTCNFSLRYPAV